MATPNLSTGASIAGTAQRVTRGITQSMLMSPTGMVQPVNQNIARSKIDQYQFPQDLPKYYFTLGMSNFNRIDAFSFAINVSSTIKLPLPKQLIDNDQVAYEQQELGQMTGALSGGASSLLEGDVQGAMTNIIGGSIGAAGSALLKTLGGITGLNAVQGAQAAFGIAPNAYTTILLKGPTYKKHEFTWTLSPRNEAESRSIRNIIKLLKNSMFVGSPASTGYFTPAQIFTPHFFNNESYLYKFKPCVLENMSVNYTPSSAPAFYSSTGAPDSVELRLSFLEMEFWFKGQY